MNEQIIHIQWKGPFSYMEVLKFRGPTDHGIYQVHGHHPVYGTKTLLYLGKAQELKFGVRLSQEGWADWGFGNGSVEFYLGRLSGETTPDDATWNAQISIVERLLIASHKVAHNSKDLNAFDVHDFYHLHVLNWGDRGGLLPEVSGARWSSRFAVITPYLPYGNHPTLSTVVESDSPEP